MKPFFSVIIPALNEEIALPKLLQSLLVQDFHSFEVLVVDGGSTDGTVGLVMNYVLPFKKRGIQLQNISKKTRNVSEGRNYGALKAGGSYFIFFDADVTVGPEFLKQVHTQIEDSGAYFLTTWIKYDLNGWFELLHALFINYSIMLARTMGRAFCQGYNIIVEHDAFKAIGGFDTTLTLGEDFYFAHMARMKGFNLMFLRKPVLTVSARRFEKEGRWRLLYQYTKSTAYFIVHGPIRRKLFDYPMGGSYYKQ